MIGEASHRLKNVLTLVAAIVGQSDGETTKALKENISQRIRGLAAAQEVLTGRQDEADLKSLVQRQLSVIVPVERPGVSIEGDTVLLSAHAAQMTGLALHELATNAVKHGALSVEEGSLSIRWRVESGSLIIEWTERGGPAAIKPTRTGFGLRVIKNALERSFAAKVELAYGHDGLTWTARFDLPSIAPERVMTERQDPFDLRDAMPPDGEGTGGNPIVRPHGQTE
jgi:two-component sensor histidine kinase